MSQQVYITTLHQGYVDQAARVLTRSFLSMNEIWKQYNLTYDEIFSIMRGKIIPSLHSGWSFVLIKGEKIIGVSIEYQLTEYIKMPSMPTNHQLFKKLAIAGQKLQKKLDLSQIKKGDAIYGLYGVIDPDYASQGYSLKFWWHLFSMGKVSGWKYYYSRISSQVSLKMLKKLGAQELASVEFQDGQKSEKLYIIKIDLRKPFPSYTMLSQMTKKPNSKL